MKRLKMMLMAMVAVLAVGAVGASAANAGTATIETGVGDCTATFSDSGVSSPDAYGHIYAPPSDLWDHSTDIFDFVPVSGECDVDEIGGELHVHWEDDVPGNPAEIDGYIEVPGIFGGTCRYGGNLTATHSPGPSFTLSPKNQSISKQSGGFLDCPLGSVTVNDLNASL